MNMKYIWDQMYTESHRTNELLWGEAHENFLDRVLYFLRKSNLSKAVILDSGCGEGRNLIYMCKQQFSVHGIDFSKVAVKTANRWIKDESLVDRASVILGDITKIPYRSKSFDVVIDIYTLEFISEKVLYIKEIMDVLKPKGFFFLKVHKPPVPHSVRLIDLKQLLEGKFNILYVNPSFDSYCMYCQN